jgi:hypothetical protein
VYQGRFEVDSTKKNDPASCGVVLQTAKVKAYFAASAASLALLTFFD